jgi:lipoate-protein ligase A
MIRDWRFLDSGALTGLENMRLDEQYARELADDASALPVLRLYRWRPWAISLGHHQSEASLDLAACEAVGIDIVRRPTGGRAILHAEELTYCVVMPAGRRSILDVYNDISRALVGGLELFGVRVQLQQSQPDFRAAYRTSSSIPCFASSARYEIEHEGRKLVGSAQRRISGEARDVVLQHGSILCGPAHKRLPEFLSDRNPSALAEVRDILDRHTADLAGILGRAPDIDFLSRCVKQGFEQQWNIMFVPDSVPTDEPQAHNA